MPPLALTQAKYAAAMFGMSVNDVPGWLVAIAPSGIGVPVAFTPGLVPHCDVLTAALLGAADAVAELPDEATGTAAAASGRGNRRDDRGQRHGCPYTRRVLPCPHLIPTSWWCRHEPSPLGGAS